MIFNRVVFADVNFRKWARPWNSYYDAEKNQVFVQWCAAFSELCILDLIL